MQVKATDLMKGDFVPHLGVVVHLQRFRQVTANQSGKGTEETVPQIKGQAFFARMEGEAAESCYTAESVTSVSVVFTSGARRSYRAETMVSVVRVTPKTEIEKLVA